MVCVLPTTSELNEALTRANAAYIAKHPGRILAVATDFETFCRIYLERRAEVGPYINADKIGRADAKLLADGFDLAMQQHGCAARAVRIGF